MVPVIALLAIAGWLYVLLVSVKTLQQNGGTDLRSRLVGARLLFTAASPYHYKWNPGDGNYLFDPNDRADRPVNGNVATPAALFLLQPISCLPHYIARWGWAGIEWIGVFIMLAIWLPGAGILKKIAWSIVPLGLFFSTAYWQYHQDRGQMYVLYAALLSGGWYFLQQKSYRPIWAGICLLLLVLCRPFAVLLPLFIFFFLPTVDRRRWLYLLFIMVLALVLPFASQWQQYFQAMEWYRLEYMGNLTNSFILSNSHFTDGTIEGASNLKVASDYEITCLQPIWYYGQKAGVYFQQLHGYAFLFSGLVGAAFYVYRQRKYSGILPLAFTIAFLLMMLAELFSFFPRAPYNMIWWVAGAGLLSSQINLNSYKAVAISISLLLALLLHSFALGHFAETLLFLTSGFVLGSRQTVLSKN